MKKKKKVIKNLRKDSTDLPNTVFLQLKVTQKSACQNLSFQNPCTQAWSNDKMKAFKNWQAALHFAP